MASQPLNLSYNVEGGNAPNTSNTAQNTDGVASQTDQKRPGLSERRTSIIFAAEPQDPRRPSIQIDRAAIRNVASGPQSAGIPSTDSAGFSPVARKRSISSPPPPPTFIKRVGFDTFENKDASDLSLTLKTKHKNYKYTRRSRTFLCGTDQNEYSTTALEWLLDELVDDGDEIVCLRVVEKDSKEERIYRHEADKLLKDVISRNEDNKAISIILEFSIGKIHDTIQQMINIYEPVMLIVGTRGRSLGGFQGLLPGSVSKYCLQHSPVPVIVVRPNNKRDKKKRQRRDDPTRRTYQDILDKSANASTLTILQEASRPSSGISTPTIREPAGVFTSDRPMSISFAPENRPSVLKASGDGQNTGISEMIKGMGVMNVGSSNASQASDISARSSLDLSSLSKTEAVDGD